MNVKSGLANHKNKMITEEQKQKKNFVLIVTGFAMILLAVFGIDAFQSGRMIIFLADISLLVFLCANVIILFLRNNVQSASVIELVGTALLFVTYLVDGRENNYQVIWIMVFPPLAVFFLSFRIGSVVAFLFAIGSAILLFAGPLSMAFVARLMGVYLMILAFATFYDWSRSRIQKKLIQSTNSLANAKKQTDAILKNVSEGIFLLDENKKITSEYSLTVLEILELEEASGADILEITGKALCAKDQKAFADYLDLLFAQKANLELLKEINPLEKTEFTLINRSNVYVRKFLNFKFNKTTDESGKPLILVTVTDITANANLEEQLQKEKQREARQMETLFQIIQIQPAVLEDFLPDSETEINKINSILKSNESNYNEICLKIYQCLHAMKGNAYAIGLENLARTIHKIEDEVRDYIDAEVKWNNLLNLTVRIFDIKKELNMIRNMLGKIRAFQSEGKGGDNQSYGLLIGSIKRLIDKAEKDDGKVFHLSTENFNPEEIPAEHRKLVKDILIQLARNTIIHGYQNAEERLASGKDDEGKIMLSCTRTEGNLMIAYHDDGRGLDLEKIRDKAVEKEIYTKEIAEKLQYGDLARLIFRPGFSTAAVVDLHAGRGVGLDSVKALVDQACGTIKLKSRQGQFTEFRIILPINSVKKV